MTDNLPRALQKEGKSAIEGQRTANLTLEALQKLRTIESAQLFYDATAKKPFKHNL